MSFIPQITCRHCGQKFSALRSRCPNCGTPHVKQTTRSTPTTGAAQNAAGAHAAANAQWQLIFGGILVLAVIIAVIILITSSLNPVATNRDNTPPETPELPPVTSEPPPTPSPTPTPTPTVGVTSITITYAGAPITDGFTQRTTWAATPLGADVYPRDALLYSKVTWRSDDESIATVDENGNVTAVGAGVCNIIAECGGVATSVKVSVPG